MDINNKLKVTILICTYNLSHLICRAIDSALNQNYKNYEIIIIDDGSNDKTKDTIAKYITKKSVLYFYQENKGLPSARNLGLKFARGQYIILLDADDELTQDAVEIIVKTFETTNAKWLHHNVIRVENNRRQMANSVLLKKNYLLYFLKNFGTIYAKCFEKKALEDIGAYDPNLFFYQDRDIWIKLLEKKIPFVYVNHPFFIEHKRENSNTTNTNEMKKLYCFSRIFFKHYKRLADNGNREVAKFYSYRMWRLASDYFHKTGDLGKTCKCLSESIIYDPKNLFKFLKKSIFLILKLNQS